MPTPASTALDNTDEHSTSALYRAALGPVNSAYYLPLFERFDLADRPGLSWNGSAALYTLNWLAFRKMWRSALLYVGIVVGAALGIFGIGRLIFQFSESVQWAMAGAIVLLSILIPGLGGNALLYAATRKRMEAALRATHTLAEASALLDRQAPKRNGLIAQMVANVLAVGLLAYAAVQFNHWEPLANLTGMPTEGRNVATGRATDVLGAPAVANVASAPATAASAPSAPLVSASAPTLASSAPMPASSAPARVASSPASVASAPAAAASATTPLSTAPPPTVAASAPQLAPSAPLAPALRPIPLPKTTAQPPAKAPEKTPEKARVAPKPQAKPTGTATPKIIYLSNPVAADISASKAGETRAPESTATAAVPGTAPQTPRYVVQVGLFADPNTARNTYIQLLDADLPATSQSTRTPQGPRIRVRIGPFDTEAEADRAADKARSLGVAATVVAQ